MEFYKLGFGEIEFWECGNLGRWDFRNMRLWEVAHLDKKKFVVSSTVDHDQCMQNPEYKF